MRVLMLVQQMDERDWLRAFIVDWVRALAAHVDQLDVITLEHGEATVPSNVTVRSLGKERGRNRLRELREFHRAMTELAPQADVIFSHMTPRYVLLAAPYARRYGKRQVLWFTHRQVSWQLTLALRLCWRVVTSVEDSFPIQSPKVRVLGHGIDSRFYSPDPSVPPESPPVIVHVARLMPIKHQETLLRALPNLPGVRAVIIGGVPTGQENHRAYAERLERQARNFGVADRVTFTGGLPAEQVRDWYRRAAVAVNLSPPGLFDKTALESMSTGTMTLVSNSAFDDLLGQHAPLLRIESPENVDELTAHLKTLVALSAIQRAKIGAALRERVIALHSVEQLMPKLVSVFATGEVEDEGESPSGG